MARVWSMTYTLFKGRILARLSGLKQHRVALGNAGQRRVKKSTLSEWTAS